MQQEERPSRLQTAFEKKSEKKKEDEKKEKEEGKLAKLRPRISAYITDVVLFWFPLGILFLVYLVFLIQGGELTSAIIDQFQSKADFIIFPVFFIYSALLIGKYGWTLGKRYTNIAVVTAGTFRKVSFLRAFLREGVKLGSFWIPYVGLFVVLLDIYLIKSTSKRQAIHDMIAGTQVITIPESKRTKKILNIAITICTIVFLALLAGVILSADLY